MKPTNKRIFSTLVAIAIATTANADHNNPWATADDVVLSKNHDANQLKSVGTPGQDEMRGAMQQRGATSMGGNRGTGGSGKGSGQQGRGGKAKGGRH